VQTVEEVMGLDRRLRHGGEQAQTVAVDDAKPGSRARGYMHICPVTA